MFGHGLPPVEALLQVAVELRLMRTVKTALDPLNLMNPGKLPGAEMNP
ncbi:MAG: linked oxidase, C-terminal domain [Nevskia sp.]|nr:linked oxidase, C-terminal domain [Nevskia sp.]